MSEKGRKEQERVKAAIQERLDERREEGVSGTLITVPANGRAISVPKQGTRINDCPTNLDLSTMRGKALMLKAMSPSEMEVSITEPCRIVAVNWVLIPDTQEDEETGEIREFVRTVFVDRDGCCFRTTSAHSPLRLCAMLELFTPQEWLTGIPLVVSIRKSKRGRLYHNIEIDTEARYGL